jgi:hypothetical protein
LGVKVTTKTTPICVFIFILCWFEVISIIIIHFIDFLLWNQFFWKFLWHSKKSFQRQGGYFLSLNPQLSPFKVHGPLMQIITLPCPFNKTCNLSFLLFVACCHFYCMCMVLISNLLGCMVFQICAKVHS